MVVIVNRFLKNTLSKIIDNPSCLLLSKKKKKKSTDLFFSLTTMYPSKLGCGVFSSVFKHLACTEAMLLLSLCFNFLDNGWHFVYSKCSISVCCVDYKPPSIHSENIPRGNRRHALFRGNKAF